MENIFNTMLIFFFILALVVFVIIAVRNSQSKEVDPESLLFPPLNKLVRMSDKMQRVEDIRPGTFYLQCNQGSNPYYSMQIFRIDSVRMTIANEMWVHYTTPILSETYTSIQVSGTERAEDFIKGKVLVTMNDTQKTVFGSFFSLVRGNHKDEETPNT